MADTVEQVHVWDGDAWVPVVRDECNLPIESVDGTVVVDGDSSVFTVSTGGEERLVVDTESLHFKDSMYADFEQAAKEGESTGQACGRIQGYDDKFFVQTLNSKPLYIRVDGTDDLQIFPSNHYVRARIGLQAGLGSAGLPAYSFYNDTNTGIYSPSDDVIAVSTGGTERVTVDADGNLIANVQIQTSRIVGSAAPDTDASIELGASATITGNRVNLVSTENDWGTTLTVQSNLMSHRYGAVNGNVKHSVKETDGTYTQILNVVYVGLDSTYNDGFGTGPGSAFYDYQTGGLNTKAKNSIRLITKNGKSGDEEVSTNLYLRSTDVDGTDNPLVSLSTKDVLMEFVGGQEILKKNSTNPYSPTQPNSIATKQTVDDKIWVGTTVQYNAIVTKNPSTLYCLTD